MDNWREKLKTGDIERAAAIAGCSSTVYRQSKSVPISEWTRYMIAINRELKKIVEDREEFLKQEGVC